MEAQANVACQAYPCRPTFQQARHGREKQPPTPANKVFLQAGRLQVHAVRGMPVAVRWMDDETPGMNQTGGPKGLLDVILETHDMLHLEKTSSIYDK